MWSLCGRFLHYAPLIPGGRFNINHILAANNILEDRAHPAAVSPALKPQLSFWAVCLKATNGRCSIPVPFQRPAPWAADYYTDAAGGTLDSPGRGCGGVAPGFWFYVPWPRKISAGVKFSDGKKLSRKLSALELVGPLICLSANFQQCKNSVVTIWVDNAGSVKIWEKGYSTSCQLCNTLVKAIACVAASAGCCQLNILKITRCSTAGAVMADALSKGDFSGLPLAREKWRLPLEMAPVPPPILRWLCDPSSDEDLGAKILCHIRKSHLALGYNC
jgi:hypothetical protein